MCYCECYQPSAPNIKLPHHYFNGRCRFNGKDMQSNDGAAFLSRAKKTKTMCGGRSSFCVSPPQINRIMCGKHCNFRKYNKKIVTDYNFMETKRNIILNYKSVQFLCTKISFTWVWLLVVWQMFTASWISPAYCYCLELNYCIYTSP